MPRADLDAAHLDPGDLGLDDLVGLASALTEARAAGDSARAEHLLLRLGHARLDNGDVAGAVTAFTDAARAARARGEPPIAAAVGAAEASLAGRDMDGLARHLRSVGAHLEGEPDEGVRTRGAALGLVAAAQSAGSFDGRAWAEVTERLVGLGLSSTRWRLCMAWAAALERHGLESDALDVYQEVAEDAWESDHLELASPARAAAARLLMEVGRFPEADAALADAAQAARQIGDRDGLSRCLAMASDLAVRMGQPLAAARHLHERADLARARDDLGGRVALLVQALRAAVRGRADAMAHELAGEVLEVLLGAPPDALPVSELSAVADDLEAAKREEDARDLLVHAARAAFRAADSRGAVRALIRAARLTAALDDRDQAREMWDEAVAIAVQHRLGEAASWAAERDRFFSVAP